MTNIIFSDYYQNEYLALRYAVMLHSPDIKLKAEGIRLLLEICKTLQWVSFQDELVKCVRNDSNLFMIVGNLASESTVDVSQLKPVTDIETFFIRLQPKDISTSTFLIREKANHLFLKGAFHLYNMVFTRYLKSMKDIPENEMHEFILKYLISSVIKKNYENAISDINRLKTFYKGYDLNIYTFLLKFINGVFNESAEDSILISNNIYEGVWNLINENDLAFYLTLSQLISFNRKTLKQIQSNSDVLIYNLFQGDYKEYENVLDNYSMCRYDCVTEEFEKYKQIIQSDPFLSLNYFKINFEIKNRILKEILNNCSKVGLNYLSKILKERDDEKIENWILSGISEGHYYVKIDDVEKIVYSDEQSLERVNMSKVLNMSKRVYTQSIFKILNEIGNRIEIKEIDIEKFKKYYIDKVRGGFDKKKESDFNESDD